MTDYPVPSRSQLRQEVRADVVGALEGVSTPLPISEERAHADAQAGLVSGLYGFLQNLARQLLPDTSEGVFLWRHTDLWLKRGRKEATPATGQVLITGSAGGSVPQGTLLSTDGRDFALVTGVTVGSNGSVMANVEAVSSGPQGNLLTDENLRLVTTHLGVDPVATVLAPGFSGGADRETEPQARSRVRERIQSPPHGGADFDYVAWAKEVPGCTRAWAVGNEMGIGTTTIRVMFDDVRADNNGFPLQADLDAVAANIDIQRPVTVSQFFVVGPDPLPVNIIVSELVGDTPEVRQRIKDNLIKAVRLRAEPGKRLFGSFLTEAISIVAGEDGHRSDVDDITPNNSGSLPFIASVTYD